jgi:hypothetical protein
MKFRSFLLAISLLAGFSTAALQGAAAATRTAPTPSKVEQETWRKATTAAPPTENGCYEIHYPSKVWTEMDCGVQPAVPNRTPRIGELPKKGEAIEPNALPQTGDWTMTPTQNITSATGKIITLTNVTSAGSINATNGALVAGQFSLQINSNQGLSGKAGSPSCSDKAANPKCIGWIQFVYNSSRQLYIQYWFLNYLNSPSPNCPAGLPLTDFIPGTNPPQQVPGTTGLDCGANVLNKVAVLPSSFPNDFTKMQGATLQGQALNGKVIITLTAGTSSIAISGPDPVGAGTSWHAAEFNVFGAGTNSNGVFQQAQLNAAARVTMGLTSDNDTSGTAPSCDSGSTTAEFSNLKLGPCQKTTVPGIGIWFNESPTPPTLTSINPSQGPITGGTAVQVNGGPFNQPFQIQFVNNNATQIVSPINTLTNDVTVLSPPGLVGVPDSVSAAYIFANGVPGPFSAPAPQQFTYFNVPFCTNTIFCPFFQNQPPSYTVTCPTPSDIYTTTGTPPSSFDLVAQNVTSNTGSTTSEAVGLAACEPGSKTDCKFFSIDVPVANWCHSKTTPPPPPTCSKCSGADKCCEDPTNPKIQICVSKSVPCPPLQ